MNLVSPKRISITNIRSGSKGKDLGLHAKASQREEEANINFLNIPPSENTPTPSNKIGRMVSLESYKDSALKSETSQQGSEKPKNPKAFMMDYLEQMVRDLRPGLSQSENIKITSSLKALHSLNDFNGFAQQYFKAYNYAFGLFLHKDESKQVVLPLKYKQAKKILFVEEAIAPQSKNSKNRKILELTRQNEELKKQVFKYRQSIKQLQKRLVFLIQEFKSRKAVYMKEIEKLISIIETSIKGIPDLITLNKQLLNTAKNCSDHQLSIPNMDPKLAKKQTEYNTLFYNYSSINEPIREPKNSLHRYKSQERIRIKQ